jgi:hypothetical protein
LLGERVPRLGDVALGEVDPGAVYPYEVLARVGRVRGNDALHQVPDKRGAALLRLARPEELAAHVLEALVEGVEVEVRLRQSGLGDDRSQGGLFLDTLHGEAHFVGCCATDDSPQLFKAPTDLLLEILLVSHESNLSVSDRPLGVKFRPGPACWSSVEDHIPRPRL